MPSIQEAMNLGDLLKFEASHFYSRDRVTVAANQNLKLGCVVAVAPDGLVKALNPTAIDSLNEAAGVLIVDADATLIECDALIVSRHAVVAHRALIWPAGITPEQRNLAITQLKRLGVLVRIAV